MGVNVMNINVGSDPATANQEQFVELHMRLPVSLAVRKEIDDLLDDDRWNQAAERLVKAHPQHEDVVHAAFKSADLRRKSAKTLTPLTA